MATKKESPKIGTAHAEIATLAPRFATLIRSHVAEDHIILDFWYGAPDDEPKIHLGRYAITLSHAKRLKLLLERQIGDQEVGRAGRSAKKTTRKKAAGKKIARKKMVRKSRKKFGKKRRKKV